MLFAPIEAQFRRFKGLNPRRIGAFRGRGNNDNKP
jgi:hypothetical protein